MKVLIVMDMLKDFMEKGGALYCGDASRKIIPFVKRKIAFFRRSGGKVIYVCDAHDPLDEEFKVFGPHAVRGSKGAGIMDEIRPVPGDVVIKKRTLSSFCGTRLEKVLKDLKPKEVHIAGACASICVMDAVGDLRARGYKVIVYRDGLADFDKNAHKFALVRMRKVYGAKLI